MADCGHEHGLGATSQHRADGGRLIAAFCVIFVFMVLEVIGGVIAGSLALIADAVHMMTDAFALLLAISAHWMAARPANRALHFGYRRFEVLAAFVNGMALVLLMLWIVYEAIHRAISPIAVEWAPMLAVAALGLFANGVAFRLLHGAGERNINIKGAMLHVASDLLGSVVAVIAAIVIWTTGWMRIDPILSIFVAVLIGRSAIKLLRQTTHILLEGAPVHIDIERLAGDLMASAPSVENVHDIKISQLTPDQLRLTLHARLKDGAAPNEALAELKRKIEADYGIMDSTIQIESGAGCPDTSMKDEARQTKRHLHGVHNHGEHNHNAHSLRGQHDDHHGHDADERAHGKAAGGLRTI